MAASPPVTANSPPVTIAAASEARKTAIGETSSGCSQPTPSGTVGARASHVCCAVGRVRHLEYFHDHVRIERMLFDGVLEPESGELRPDRSRPGLGLTFRADDAAQFAA